MSHGSRRWKPPHPSTVVGYTVSAVLRCVWMDCKKPVHGDLGVPICLDHAKAAHNAYARMTEANAAAATEKVDAGLRLDRGERAPGWIYYIEIDSTIKIGYTANVYTRMRAYPPTAKLLAVEPGTRNIERARHSIFGVHLAHGREWFNDHPDIRTWIATLRDEYGDPSHMAYTYTVPTEAPPIVASGRIKRRYS